VRIISYAGERFLTSDAVAAEVLHYSKLLAFGETSDVVNIPVVLDGRIGDADLIIGPASQITSIDADADADEVDLDDSAAIEDLRRRAALLESPPPVQPEDDAGRAANQALEDS
jgi:hypothetical protein